MSNYFEYFKTELNWIEEGLERTLPKPQSCPTEIFEAMRYAVLGGGKRFRPLLSLLSCEVCGGDPKDALIAGVSAELVHCYSLVHDDLPSLDNDDERRGKPTCHVAYGEAMAVLTGDALLNLAFENLGRMDDAEVALRVLRELSTASGSHGMIGGQVADIAGQREDCDLPMTDFISVHKTGQLIKASAMIGAYSAKANDRQLQSVLQYGECLGLAFQVVDDILDGDGYLKQMSVSEAHDLARDLVANAKRQMRVLGNCEKLIFIADQLLKRVEKEKYV